MNIRKFLHSGAAVLAVLYAMSAMPVYADVCFLGTGDCGDQDSSNEKPKSCEEYRKEGNLYTAKQPGKNCERVNINIPNCNLYSCSEADCKAKDFVLGPTNSSATYPTGRSASDWNCSSCQQGSQYWWTCHPKMCDGGTVLSSNCDRSTHRFDKVSKSGYEDCGYCRTVVASTGEDQSQGRAIVRDAGVGSENNPNQENNNTGPTISLIDPEPGNVYTSPELTSQGPNYVARKPDYADGNGGGSGYRTAAGARGDSSLSIPDGFCSDGLIEVIGNTVKCRPADFYSSY